MTDFICASTAATNIQGDLTGVMWWQNKPCTGDSKDVTSLTPVQVQANVKGLRGLSLAIPKDLLATFGSIPKITQGLTPVVPGGTATSPTQPITDAKNAVLNSTPAEAVGNFIKLVTKVFGDSNLWKGVFLIVLAGVTLIVGVVFIKGGSIANAAEKAV